MQVDEIQKFLEKQAPVQSSKSVKISFKSSREPIYGLFLQHQPDFKDLSSKNFWRIVPQNHISDYNRSNNESLARIFNGADFSRLSLYEESFEE